MTGYITEPQTANLLVKIPLKYSKPSLEEVAQRFTTQIHSLCGQVKICQKALDIFLTDRCIRGIK